VQIEVKNHNKKFYIALTALGLLLLLSLAIINWPQQPAKSTPNTAIAKKINPPHVQLSLLATGLSSPTAIVSTNQPQDHRLFVTDRAGVIRIVQPDGSVASSPFLDISSQVLAKDEMGLLGLAFSPKFTQDGYFFVNYIDHQQNTVIARYHLSTDANKADPASETNVLTLKQPYPNHNGGDLLFGADGYLYATLGDGGSAADPENRAQNLSVMFGKILRLDVSQLPYKIPPTNPFINQPGKLAEIWDYGLRNPWKISFDRQSHELLIADVGQGDAEEVDVEPSGHGGNNYGWRCYEGSRDYNLNGCSSRDKYVFPVLDYNHTEQRCSITGGYVYRGHKYTALKGKYFYGDYCSGQVFFATKENNKWISTLAATTQILVLVAFTK
jgi:glucose/arabinose dehydrogenase